MEMPLCAAGPFARCCRSGDLRVLGRRVVRLRERVPHDVRQPRRRADRVPRCVRDGMRLP